jgi:hypothetical protein
MRRETMQEIRHGVLGAIVLAAAMLVPRTCPARVSGAPAPHFESGTYDVLTRGAQGLPVPTGRAVALHVHRQTIEADTFVDGSLQRSRILVADGPIQYDLHAHRWYQDFETKPNNPKATHERVRIWFRDDALGAYDISYRRRNDTWASEILVKRPPSDD